MRKSEFHLLAQTRATEPSRQMRSRCPSIDRGSQQISCLPAPGGDTRLGRAHSRKPKELGARRATGDYIRMEQSQSAAQASEHLNRHRLSRSHRRPRQSSWARRSLSRNESGAFTAQPVSEDVPQYRPGRVGHVRLPSVRRAIEWMVHDCPA